MGALTGAIDVFLDSMNGRKTRGAVVLGGSKVRDFQAVQMRVGRAVANLKAAKAMLFSQIEESRSAVMDRGEILDVGGRLDNRLAQAKTVELAVDGLDELLARWVDTAFIFRSTYRELGAMPMRSLITLALTGMR